MDFKKDLLYINIKKLKDEGYPKIKVGLFIIILSPLLGSLLFYIYSLIIGFLISTDGQLEMLWVMCILVMALFGVTLVLTDYMENKKHYHNS